MHGNPNILGLYRMLVATKATLGNNLALSLPDSLAICTYIGILFVCVNAAMFATRLNRRLHLEIHSTLLLHLLLLMLSVYVHSLLTIANYCTIIQSDHSSAAIDLAVGVYELGIQAGC